ASCGTAASATATCCPGSSGSVTLSRSCSTLSFCPGSMGGSEKGGEYSPPFPRFSLFILFGSNCVTATILLLGPGLEEQLIQRCDRVILHRREDVSISLQGHRDRGVPQPSADHLDVHTSHEQTGRTSVPQVVKAEGVRESR